MHHPFAGLGLAPALTRAVTEQGYGAPTPIQTQAIPPILAGHDVLAGAQTGTGKTAAFTLPLLQRLAGAANTSASPARHPIRALIVTPTRELAAQVAASIAEYGRHLPLRSAVVYGGVGMNPQIDILRRGVDILVATPGRLLDHAAQKTVDLSRVEILVLDEADRMLDMGFIRDIRRLLDLLPAKRQNLLFSATFSTEIRRLAEGLLHQPVTVQVARRNAEAELVTQWLYEVPQEQKRHALAQLVRAGGWTQVLVFTRTKHGANRLAEQLARAGITATAIHGNKSQPQRLKALADFKEGGVRVLVATDIAARGLDIEALPHVVNFDLPHVAEDYVHRIGRTGRAGMSGEAISLVSPQERSDLAAIEKLIGRRIERRSLSGMGSAEPDGHARQPQATHADVAANGKRASHDQARRESRRHDGTPQASRRPQLQPPGARHAHEAAVRMAASGPKGSDAPAAPAHVGAPRHAESPSAPMAADAASRRHIQPRRSVGALLGATHAAEDR